MQCTPVRNKGNVHEGPKSSDMRGTLLFSFLSLKLSSPLELQFLAPARCAHEVRISLDSVSCCEVSTRTIPSCRDNWEREHCAAFKRTFDKNLSMSSQVAFDHPVLHQHL
jgi:hypothetical protein